MIGPRKRGADMTLIRAFLILCMALFVVPTSFAGKTPAPPKAKAPAPAKKEPRPCGTGKAPCPCSIC